MRRTFVGAPGQADTAYIPPALVAHSLVSRIETISCTSSSAPLLSAYDRMQSCTHLAVSVAEDEPLPRALALPALECIEISSAVGSRVRTAELVPPLSRLCVRCREQSASSWSTSSWSDSMLSLGSDSLSLSPVIWERTTRMLSNDKLTTQPLASTLSQPLPIGFLSHFRS